MMTRAQWSVTTPKLIVQYPDKTKIFAQNVVIYRTLDPIMEMSSIRHIDKLEKTIT